MSLAPLVLVLATALAAEKVPVQRFALIAGSNEGGPGRMPLRYAASDAAATSRVLEQLGGIAGDHRILLVNPSLADFSAGLERMHGLLAAARAGAERLELLLYYSGHSDETGLLLGREQLGYSELRAALARMPSDVRIAVLDSCASGALIRAKGGQHVAPFLLDGATAVRGHAFLTATSADEAAQESDGVRGSYFTYALLTGLRGAADASRDGKVTLHEAYQFAYDETLARTERSRGGPQHPAYDIQLVGTGDLVLTDLRGSSAGLVLGKDIEGRLFLRDASGNLVAELRKPGGSAMELGLEPGVYHVTVEVSGGVFASEVSLSEGKRAELRRESLKPVGGEAVTLRGATPQGRVVPVGVSIASFDLNPADGPVTNYLALSLLAGTSTRLEGVALGFGLNRTVEEMTGAQIGLINLAGGGKGVQIGNLANVTSKRFVGLQVANFANIANGGFSGFQVSQFANIASGGVTGLQVSGVLNTVRGPSRGLAVAGMVNVAADGLEGVQIAGLANYAASTDLQAAPVNVAGDTFMQLGVVNVARRAVSGLQLGVINVAEHSDWPVGLLNFIEDGYRVVGVWGSDATVANVGVKLGGRRLYALLALGGQPRTKPFRWSLQAGLGVHTERRRWLLDVDLSTSSFFDGGSGARHSYLTTLRVMPGFKLFGRVTITGGPALNLMVSSRREDLDLALGPQEAWRRGDTTVRLFTGFMLGVQI